MLEWPSFLWLCLKTWFINSALQASTPFHMCRKWKYAMLHLKLFISFTIEHIWTKVIWPITKSFTFIFANYKLQNLKTRLITISHMLWANSNQPTNGPTYQWTNRPLDKAAYRVVCKQLKNKAEYMVISVACGWVGGSNESLQASGQ